MKTAVIGGGSFLWTFGIIRQFVDSQHLSDVTLSLMDIDPDALKLVHAAGQIYIKEHGSPVKLLATTDLDEALDGAEYVIVCISTGGLDAMAFDLDIPRKYGVVHTVGDTVGPAGISRTVRNVPVFAHIAERMHAKCPGAWMLNITNPLTPLTRVPNKLFGIQTFGICTGSMEMADALVKHAGLKWERVEYVLTGINHGAWYTKLFAQGQDVLARIRDMGFWRDDDELPETIYLEDQKVGVYGARALFAVWRTLGVMPAINDRHCVENWPWFLHVPDGKLGYGLETTPIEKRYEGKKSRRKALEKIVADGKVGSRNALGHGDDPIVAIIESLRGFRSITMPVNCPNIGQIPEAPAGAVVETCGIVDAAGVHPHASPMPPAIQCITLPHIIRQEALIDIAMNGSFDDLVAITASDPICTRMKIHEPRQMMRELMEAHRQYIPNPRLLEF